VVTPERRTRGDVVAVAVLVVAVITAATVLWRFSDARATVSEPAVGEAPALVPPTALPPSLAEVWSAPSGATPIPLVAGSTVVTADGREVVGRDPLTGELRWRYARDIDLCTATSAWGQALTVWSKNPRFCSEVTSIGGDSGKRVNQRNGDAERGTRVLSDGTHVTAIGERYLESWRSDLVRTTQYGKVPAPVNPGKQPRTGCSYASIAVAANQIGLIERCPPNDATPDGDRLTVLKANPEHAEQPEPVYSIPLGIQAAQVVAVSANRAVLLLANPTRLAVYNEDGSQVGNNPVDAPLPTGGPAPSVAHTTASPGAVYWFTGTSTIALDPNDFHPLWTVPGTLGSGVIFAGRLLVPAPGELVVLDAQTGERLGATPVDRGGYDGPVELAAAGPVVLEQRGARLVALR
jgi:hypothetical protein